MSVECKHSNDFADTLGCFLCQSYIEQGFVRGERLSCGSSGAFVWGHLSGAAFVLPSALPVLAKRGFLDAILPLAVLRPLLRSVVWASRNSQHKITLTFTLMQPSSPWMHRTTPRRRFLANINSLSRSLYVVVRPSVCNVRARYSDNWNFRQFFYTIGYTAHPLTHR